MSALSPGSQARLHRRFIVLLAVAFLVFLALLEYTFWRFPNSRISSGTGPKANVPIWFGPDGAGLFYLGLGAVYAGLYLWVGSQSRPSMGSWRTGTLWGLILGVTGLVVSVLTAWLPKLGALRPLSWLAFLSLTVFAGAVAARATGRAHDGALAGFWCGLVAAVLFAGSIIAVDNAFATTLAHSSWLHDPTCPQSSETALAACEIGDTLGFVAVELTLLPLLFAGIGAIGGAIGSARTGGRQAGQRAIVTANARPEPPSSWRAPVIFAGLMLALFLAEITLKLI